jgi:RNA polymerase sigma factor (sigma-70 family)
MKETLILESIRGDQDRLISDTVKREQARLRNFIRRRVADRGDAEDILQEVLYEFVETYRLLKPIEQAGAWLFRVARNRIIDLFRRKRPGSLSDPVGVADDGEEILLEDLLPSSDAGPEAAYARQVLIEELESAVEELPQEQREVFIAHEIEGRSFKELAAQTGLSVNTLLARKRYAVLHLRRKLQAVHDEFIRE